MEKIVLTRCGDTSCGQNIRNMSLKAKVLNITRSNVNVIQWNIISLKKAWNSDMLQHLDEPWRHYAKWNKPVTKRHTEWFIYMRYLYLEWSNIIEAESRILLGLCGEMGSYCLVGTEFWFCKMKKILEMDKGVGHTTIWMYLIRLNCTLQKG